MLSKFFQYVAKLNVIATLEKKLRNLYKITVIADFPKRSMTYLLRLKKRRFSNKTFRRNQVFDTFSIQTFFLNLYFHFKTLQLVIRRNMFNSNMLLNI